MAKLIPIHKTGDKQQIGNYRPISLTCVCCKLLEHIISKSIYTYFEHNKIFFPNQHGFRQRLSTTTQLMETINDFSSALNNKKQLDAICLDFSKAFDRVVHSLLISKLAQMGIDLNLLEWILAYLSGRTQYVEISGTRSSTLAVSSGVPQGSVLGPVLFLAYINDISSGISEDITVRLYADDCLLYREINEVNDQKSLSDALAAIEIWCEKWKMKINEQKTVVFRVSNKIKNVLDHKYFVNSRVLATVDTNYQQEPKLENTHHKYHEHCRKKSFGFCAES